MRQDKKDKILFVLFFTNFRDFPLFLKKVKNKKIKNLGEFSIDWSNLVKNENDHKKLF